MSNIFLSYDRDDEARARPIAALLERAGHPVWWDRQIKGGGEFGAEIEAALDAADKIIVLWSQRSVKSAWVRDEAAVGRDTGRLVPVTIDGTPAPLGFRQYQTIDLSKWRGRGDSSQVKDLLDALGATTPFPTTPRSKSSPLIFRLSRRLLLLGSGTIIAIVAAGALLWQVWSTGGDGTPTFAILPADSSAASKQLASDVATRVASLNDPSGADFHMVAADSAWRSNGYALKVGAGSAGRSGQTLTLVSGRNNTILWSSPLEVADSPNDLVQAIAVTAQRALSCAADVLTYRREKIDEETLKLYLNGCTQYDAAYGTNSSNTSVDKLFLEVIAKAPHFVPAWSKLFEVESEDLFTAGHKPMSKTLQTQLERAKQLGIDVAEAYAIRANLRSPADFVGIFRTFDEGIAKHPDNAFLFRSRGERYFYVGRMNDAVGDTRHAVQLDSLSPANQQTFASALAYSGDAAAGYVQLRKAEELWPNSTTLGMARYRLDLRFGNPQEAQALYREYALLASQYPAQGKFIEARISPTPKNIEAALEAERKINRQFPPFTASLIQALGYFGRKDEAIDLLVNSPDGKWHEWIGYNAEVLFRPMMRDVWRDPRSMAGAAHVGLLHYWEVSGNWPDFCFDPTLPYNCKKEAAKYHA
jgi:tetratricopeptide (TPR) repeat protein